MRLLLPLLLVTVALSACGSDDPGPAQPTSTPQASAGPEETAAQPRARDMRAEVNATGLEVPWEIVFLPDGRALVTERVGRVRLLSARGELREQPIARIAVDDAGEGGLMGMAVRDDFVFLYMTRGGVNQLVRYRFANDELTQEKILVDGIDASSIHSGGRLKFGPDDMLYLSVGDAAEPSVAQDRESLNGKFLRVDPRSGEAEVYSYGHRNPQGFDWEPGSGRLIADEHGQSGNDEVNVIREGANYGWPVIEGQASRAGMQTPIKLYQSPSAPSGGTFLRSRGSAWTGSYFIAMLAGARLQRIVIEGDAVVEEQSLLEGRYGRLREVVEGPDGALYLLTSNRDGRGDPTEDDDRIIRVEPPGE
jgi:glucose/arabinose dehydrogenase